MRIFLLSFALFCLSLTSVHSIELGHLKIRDLNVNYDGFQGELSSSTFDVGNGSTLIETTDYRLEVSKLEGNMYFVKNDTRIALTDVEGGVFGSLGILQINGLDLDYLSSGQLALKFQSVEIESGDGIQKLGKLDLKCKSQATRNGDIFSFLRPCTEYGVLFMPELSFADESKKSVGEALVVADFQKQYLNEGHDVSIQGLLPDRIKDLLVNIKNKAFSLKGKVKILFNLNLKANGNVEYHEQSSELEVHLDKAKVGVFGITGTVLKKIKEAKLKNVRVSGKSIFIKI